MTIDALVFFVTFAMLVAAFAMAFKSVHDIEKLKDKLANVNDAIRYTRNDCSELTRKLILIEKDLCEIKKGHDSQIAQMSDEIDALRREVLVQINMLNDQLKTHVVDKEADKIDIETEAVDEDIMYYPETYRWIFPGSDQTSGKECSPILGKQYLVVGTINDKSDLDWRTKVVTERAQWNGYLFVADSGSKFSNVYAYIQQPSSSDIWQKVLSLAIEAEE